MNKCSCGFYFYLEYIVFRKVCQEMFCGNPGGWWGEILPLVYGVFFTDLVLMMLSIKNAYFAGLSCLLLQESPIFQRSLYLKLM